MTLTKCTLCGSENTPTLCQFNDEFVPLCLDCVEMSMRELIAKLYRKSVTLKGVLGAVKDVIEHEHPKVSAAISEVLAK